MFSVVLVLLSGSFSNIKFIAKLPANPPLKDTWKESVFSLTAGVEDRLVATHHQHSSFSLMDPGSKFLGLITCFYDCQCYLSTAEALDEKLLTVT